MNAFAAIALAWGAALAVVALHAALRRRPPDLADDEAPVLLLRPCAGAEPELARALASSRAAGTRARVRFLVASESDGALAIARAAAGRLAGARVVITGARGPNRKADQLHRALEGERDAPDVIVVADSDVALDRWTLATLVGPIARGEADATWAPPVEIAPRTLGDRAVASVLDASLHAFVLLSVLDPRGMVGKLFAVRRSALTQVGGFGALVRHLGEDVELARRLRKAGLRVRATRAPARSLACGRTPREALERCARWIAVIRAQRWWLLPSYPLLFASAPLAACVAACGGAQGAVALAALVVVRLGAAALARRRAGRSLRGLPLDACLADALLLAAFVRALATRTFVWRGVPVRPGPGGLLTAGSLAALRHGGDEEARRR